MQPSRLKTKAETAVLLIYCPDRQGIIADVTRFLKAHNGNIVYLDQHVDHEKKIFYMRVAWELDGFALGRKEIAQKFQQEIAGKFKMTWKLNFSNDISRMAVFVSKMPHCLFDILSRYATGEWQVQIPLIISNHADLKPVAKQFGIDYYHLPVNKKNKTEQEKAVLELLTGYKINFMVLARYMQILSGNFVKHYSNRIINIHHSFLPAFAGAKPYHAAHRRGVKIIGATSHYVTSELDEGPIIEQDVARCSHVDTVTSLIRKGKDLEKIVLSKTIYKHLQHKILVFNNRTVVFE